MKSELINDIYRSTFFALNGTFGYHLRIDQNVSNLFRISITDSSIRFDLSLIKVLG